MKMGMDAKQNQIYTSQNLSHAEQVRTRTCTGQNPLNARQWRMRLACLLWGAMILFFTGGFTAVDAADPDTVPSVAPKLSLLAAEDSAEDAPEGAGDTLKFISSGIPSGAQGVPIDPVIRLDFSGNVCNSAVIDENKNCFHLTDTSGTPVPITLIFPDDQAQTEYQQQVFIKPKDNLLPETLYKLSIDRTLRDKDGSQIDNATAIYFTTGDQLTETPEPGLAALGESILSFEMALPETENSFPHIEDPEGENSIGDRAETDDEKANSEERAGLSQNALVALVVGAGLVLIGVLSGIIIIRNKRKA